MSDEVAPEAFLQSVQPALLVGGRSRRFGRDKLLEPLPGTPESEDHTGTELLVDRPLRVLRAVFGPRVMGVGACDPAVAARLDRHLDDGHPGAGPAAGILAALAAHTGPVFVLAGDMPCVTAATVRRIVDHALRDSARAAAVLARTDELQPCFGVYFPSAAPALSRAVGGERSRSLHDTLRELAVVGVTVSVSEAANINSPGDLTIANDARRSGRSPNGDAPPA